MSSRPRSRVAPGLVPAAVFIGSVVVLVAILSISLATDPITAVVRAWESLFPPPAITDQGQEIRSLYEIVFIIAAVIFFVVEGLIVWTVIRYRRQPGDDELPPQIHGNNLAETIWTVVPTLIVAFLFVISWQTLNNIERVSDEPGGLEIRVRASQFTWAFEYLDANGANEYVRTTPNGADPDQGGLVLPTGRNVKFLLTSEDVIHAFYVPAFLYKRDVNPEVDPNITEPGASPVPAQPDGPPQPKRENVFEVRIDDEYAGLTFSGQCAELCGIGHRAMTFNLHVLSPSEYDAWFDRALAPAPSASVGPVETTLQVSALNIAFDTTSLEVPADKPFAIEFQNQDPAGVLHDIDIRQGSQTLQDQPTIDGGESTTYTYPPLPAGEYTFICSIHPVPAMTGTLTVQ